MKVLVFGGREYNEIAIVHDELDRLHREEPITLLIQGGAPGADSCGKMWAINNGVPIKEFRAEWEKHGKKAGPIRNQMMLDWGQPDLAIGFPGGRGTADMRKRVIAECVELVEPCAAHQRS